MVIWSAHTKHILPFNSSNTKQAKSNTCKVVIDESKGAWARKPVLMMGKTRRRERAQFSRLV